MIGAFDSSTACCCFLFFFSYCCSAVIFPKYFFQRGVISHNVQSTCSRSIQITFFSFFFSLPHYKNPNQTPLGQFICQLFFSFLFFSVGTLYHSILWQENGSCRYSISVSAGQVVCVVSWWPKPRAQCRRPSRVTHNADTKSSLNGSPQLVIGMPVIDHFDTDQ